MKCILLAAGRGTRISKMIDNVPKCTLAVGDVPLIRRTILMLKKLDIEPIVCVGYQQDIVKKAIEGTNTKTIYNPFYDVTNSIASLWFAQDELDDDIIVMNADVFLEQEALEEMINDKRKAIMAIDKTKILHGDYFFGLDENGCIIRYGKELAVEDRDCEYVGLAKIRKEFLPTFKEELLTMISEQKHDRWWEDVLYQLSEKDVDINTLDISKNFWREVDYYDDYEIILDYIAKEPN